MKRAAKVTWYRRGGSVVDIGCGQGTELTTLREAGCRAFGLELVPEAARACRAMAHPVIGGAAQSLPCRGESCHGIP